MITVVLNLRKHKRDAKRLPQLKKFLVFFMETHVSHLVPPHDCHMTYLA